ncbi:MAG: zinc-ribbon domain-containing protein [Candidatus Lokiarchaeota archaeon]|nr:zinc-ribbon domain-containing protein [Candidatus Lokiarchaeota archaeon]
MICPECSEDIKENVLFCPYCGYKLKIEDNLDKKNIKIQELEQKIVSLEKGTKKNNNYYNNLERANRYNQYTSYNYKKEKSSSEKCGIACAICLIFFFFISFFSPFWIYF